MGEALTVLVFAVIAVAVLVSILRNLGRGRSLRVTRIAQAEVHRDLAGRARALVSAGREDDAVRLVVRETGLAPAEASAFVRGLRD